MQNKVNRPIFVVGSPRSGTSILTWCLGQHPNIFAVPESNWMGDFVVNTAVVHQVGAARGRSEEHTSELQSQSNLVCRLLLEKKKNMSRTTDHSHSTIRTYT